MYSGPILEALRYPITKIEFDNQLDHIAQLFAEKPLIKFFYRDTVFDFGYSEDPLTFGLVTQNIVDPDWRFRLSVAYDRLCDIIRSMNPDNFQNFTFEWDYENNEVNFSEYQRESITPYAQEYIIYDIRTMLGLFFESVDSLFH